MAADELCFDCLGAVDPSDLSLNNVQRLNSQSHDILISFMDVCLRLGNDSEICDVVTYRMFEYTFDERSVLENLDPLFRMAMQKFGRLERHVTEVNCEFQFMQKEAESSPLFYKNRLEICHFTHSLGRLSKRLPMTKETRNTILLKLLDFLLRVGQMSSLPCQLFLNMGSVQGNRCDSSVFHLTHLHLDLKVYTVLLLMNLDDNEPEDVDFVNIMKTWLSEIFEVPIGFELQRPCDQYASLVVWDLISLALASFEKVAISDYFVSSPFPCSCCRDLWIFVLQLLDKRPAASKISFWLTLHTVFQAILDEESHPVIPLENTSSVFFKVRPDFSGVNRLGFCWWLLLHLSSLYEIADNDELRSNNFEIINLLKKMLNAYEDGCSENQLRVYMRCCISICKKWEASSEAPLFLWEYFFRRLNDTFISLGEVSTTIYFGKSGLDWIQAIKSITNNEIENQAEGSNSYQLFLRLVAIQLKKSSQDNSASVWRQLKGRIFSKFHPRKIQELNTTGLHNCFCLFLTLASMADLEDVVCKVCDLMDMMAPAMADHNKHCLVWKAMFALMVVCEERNLDIALPAGKMAEEFNTFSKDVVRKRTDTLQSHMSAELLTIYMEGLQDIFECSSSLSLSEYILIAPTLSEFLSDATISELQLALMSLQVVLARHRMVSMSVAKCNGDTVNDVCCSTHFQHEALADALWCYCWPIVKEKALADCPLGVLADVASGFTLLIINAHSKVPRSVKETFSSLMQYFCFGFNCGVEFCSRYLYHSLSQKQLFERMEKEFPDCQAELVRIWIRLALQLPDTNSEMQELTRFILKMPEAAIVFEESGHPVPCLSTALVTFFQALNIYQEKCPSQALKLRQKISIYFSDVAITMNSILMRGRANEVTNLYNAIGQLVRHIPSLIHVRSKPDCLLNQVIRTMLLPVNVYSQDKVIPAAHLHALRDTFPLFIEGFYRLGCRRDPFIGRTVKEIFVHYLPRYSLVAASSSSVAPHPLVASLVAVMRTYDAHSDFFMVVMEAIHDTYLMRRSASFSMGIGFISDVLIRCATRQRAACGHQLVPLLLNSLMLHSEDENARHELLDVLKMLKSAATRNDVDTVPEETSERFSFLGTLESLIQRQFSVQTERLLRLLVFLSDSFPDDVVQLVPLLSAELNRLEMTKGTGIDDKLRIKYNQFLTNIKVDPVPEESKGNMS